MSLQAVRSISDLYQVFVSETMIGIQNSEIDHLIQVADVKNHSNFFAVDASKYIEHTKQIVECIVIQILNHPDRQEVPIRIRTKWVVFLNCLVLHKPVTHVVRDALKDLGPIFENAMIDEGSMKFDSELGRMSEHVLVLLMRICGYKLKASAVYEFTEGHTQFGIQLLLAILHKTPPYEFELRSNCINAWLGFTQPQTFFQSGETIQFNTCSSFNNQINFILNISMQHRIIPFVDTILMTELDKCKYKTLPILHLVLASTVRATMNIFHFSTDNGLKWRQHILVSTRFIQNSIMTYVNIQVYQLTLSLQHFKKTGVFEIDPEILRGLMLALKFIAFSTYHMGLYAQRILPASVFIPQLMALPYGTLLTDSKYTTELRMILVYMLYSVINIDALCLDGISPDTASALPGTLQPGSIATQLGQLVQGAIGTTEVVSAYYQELSGPTRESLVAHDTHSYHVVRTCFLDAIQGVKTTPEVSIPHSELKSGVSIPHSELKSGVSIPHSELKSGVSIPHSELKSEVPVPHSELKSEVPVPHSELKSEVSILQSELESGVVPISRKVVVPHEAQSKDEFVCSLSYQVMKNPVESPYGHLFDREVIHQWITQQGNLCPITGKPLHMKELKFREDIQKSILISQVNEWMNQDNTEDNIDLYQF